MRAYNQMSLFRQSIMCTSVHSSMATLRHPVFTAPRCCADDNGPRADQYAVAVPRNPRPPRQRRAWFSERWSAALDPLRIPDSAGNTS